MTDTTTTTTATPADAKPPPLRALGEAAGLTAGLVHIIDDDPDAVNTLIEVAGTRRFEHRIQQLRHARESQRAYDAAVAEYTERGYQVIE